MSTSLHDALARSGLRTTTPRQVVFDLLQGSSCPLKMADIVKQCSSIDKTSVYRSIDLFRKLNILSTASDGWRQYYELSDEFRPHHHHLICTKCGKIIDIKSPAIEKLVKQIGRDNGFDITGHNFEIVGLCPNCAPKLANK